MINDLSLTGLPVVLGIVPGDTIAWKLAGVPLKAEQARSVVASWLHLK